MRGLILAMVLSTALFLNSCTAICVVTKVTDDEEDGVVEYIECMRIFRYTKIVMETSDADK